MDEEGGYGRGQIISDTPDCHGTSVVGTVRTDLRYLSYEKLGYDAENQFR